MKLFDFDTLHDFFACYSHAPRVAHMFQPTGERRPRVTRALDGGGSRTAHVNAYMLFRRGVEPDYKHEVDGKRTVLSAWNMRVAAGGLSLEAFTQAVWETTIFLLIGETIDPAECVAGVWLEDRTRGRGSAFNLEIWFAARDDATCEAVCEALRHELNRRTEDDQTFDTQRARYPRFRKLAYFAEKKHRFEKPGEWQGSPFGGMPLELPQVPDGVLVNPKPEPGEEEAAGAEGGSAEGGGGGGWTRAGPPPRSRQPRRSDGSDAGRGSGGGEWARSGSGGGGKAAGSSWTRLGEVAKGRDRGDWETGSTGSGGTSRTGGSFGWGSRRI